MRQSTGIFHFEIQQPISIQQFITSQGYTKDNAASFLYRGCVYINGQRIRENIELQTGQILRLHTQPKSYTWEPGPLKDRIVFDDPEFLVLDKPAGLPVHATLDNYIDNAKFQLERELKIPLYSTHRLDIPTQGLLILAKTPAAQRVLNKTFAEGRVTKIYHATTQVPVALGEHTLYLNPDSRVPREHSFERIEGWWKCQLVVEACDKQKAGFILKIRLITGKTHQIRAQLSALGAPICGDLLYGSPATQAPERLALECSSLSFTFRSRPLTLTRSPSPQLHDPPVD